MLNKDFKEFVGLLNSANVEYLLVGDLKANKRAAARPKDLADLDALDASGDKD
jgi:hypothetical protein